MPFAIVTVLMSLGRVSILRLSLDTVLFLRCHVLQVVGAIVLLQ